MSHEWFLQLVNEYVDVRVAAIDDLFLCTVDHLRDDAHRAVAVFLHVHG